MGTCIYKKIDFEHSDGEHVLQNFLGARWTSGEIVCNEVQGIFGQTIDSALEQGLKEFRVLLGTKGGRGGEGPSLKNFVTSDGNKYHLLPGGVMQIAEPIISQSEQDNDTHVVAVKIESKKQIGWALAKLRSEFPGVNWTLDSLTKNLIKEVEYPTERIRLRVGIGGEEYFRGLLKAVFNLLGSTKHEIAMMDCFDDLRNFVLDGSGEHTKFIRWDYNPEKMKIPSKGEFDHFIAVYSENGNVNGVAQFFGGINHIFRLTDSYSGPDFKCAYLVNPLRDTEPAEERNPEFNHKLLPKFELGFIKPGPDVWPIYEGKINSFLNNYFAYTSRKIIEEIVEGALSPHEGEIITEAMLDELGTKLRPFLESRVQSS